MTNQSVYDAFNEQGFSKYYLLTLTDKACENLLGSYLDEFTDYRIGEDTPYGELLGILVAKPPMYQDLGDSGLEILFMVDDGDNIRIGTLVGDHLYDADLREIAECVPGY